MAVERSTAGYQGGTNKKSLDNRYKRERLFDEQSGLCACCSRPMRLGPYHEGGVEPDTATIDEIIPQAAGGSRKWGNIQLLRFECNQRKGDNIFLSERQESQLQAQLTKWLAGQK